MKKHLLHLSLGISLILLFGSQQAMAQDKKSSKIHITITENDKVTTDTTFELKEGQDPEMIKKVISHLAGDDLHKMHMSQDVHVSHDVHKSHGGQKEMVWIHSDGEKAWHGEHGMECINIDSIKKVHKGAKVLVIKNKDGEIEVKELDGDEDHEMFFEGDEHGKHHKMMFIESGDNDDVMHIKEAQGEKTIIIHTQGDDCDGREQKIEVIIHSGDDMEWTEKDGENVEVYVIKKGDKDVKVVKEIRVIIKEDDEAEKETETKEKKKKK